MAKGIALLLCELRVSYLPNTVVSRVKVHVLERKNIMYYLLSLYLVAPSPTYRIQRVDLLRGEPSAVPISHLPVNVTRDQRCMVGNLDSIYIRKQPKVSARQMREKIYVYY